MCISLIPIVAGEMKDSFGLSGSQIGLLTSMFMVTTALGAIPMGLAAVRWGGRVLLLSGGIFIAGLALFASASSFSWFVVARLLQGIGASSGPPAATALIAQSLDRRMHGWALGIMGCGQGVGVLLTLLIMPSIQAAAGYRAVFLATAGIVAVMVLLTLLRPEMRRLPVSWGQAGSLAALLSALRRVALNPRLLLLIVVNIGAIGLFVGIVSWTPAFLHDQRGTSLAVAAYLTAGMGLAQLLGSPVGATAMVRWGKEQVLFTGILIMMVATVLVPFAPGVAGPFVCVVVTGFLTLAMLPVLLGSIPEVVSGPDEVGAATGYMYTVNLVSTMLAPWLFGVLLDNYGVAEGDPGYKLGYQMLALFALLGVIAAGVYAATRKRAARVRAVELP
jgi:MFS family permease